MGLKLLDFTLNLRWIFQSLEEGFRQFIRSQDRCNCQELSRDALSEVIPVTIEVINHSSFRPCTSKFTQNASLIMQIAQVISSGNSSEKNNTKSKLQIVNKNDRSQFFSLRHFSPRLTKQCEKETHPANLFRKYPPFPYNKKIKQKATTIRHTTLAEL